MRKNTPRLLANIIFLASLNTAQAQPLTEIDEPAEVQNGILVDKEGMTLYVFDKDSITPSKSVCIEQCAINWPPLFAQEGDQSGGDWSIINRDDKHQQWTYKGQPLYRWIKDANPGDMRGEGMAGNTWHVAKP